MMKSDLTEQEQAHVRGAIRGLELRAEVGGRAIGAMLGIERHKLYAMLRGETAVTASIAFRVARLLETSIDELLAGRYHPPGVCPYCGRGEAA